MFDDDSPSRRLVAFIGVLWAAWGFIGGLFGDLIEPAGRFLMNQLTGNVALPGPAETLAAKAAAYPAAPELELAGSD